MDTILKYDKLPHFMLKRSLTSKHTYIIMNRVTSSNIIFNKIFFILNRKKKKDNSIALFSIIRQF